MGDTKINQTDERILAARQSLADRISVLEDKVTISVDNATSTIDNATNGIRTSVKDAVDGVRGLFDDANTNLHGLLDVRRQVRDRPWQGILLAVGAGLAARMMTKRKSFNAVFSGVDGKENPLAELLTVVRKELVGIGETALETVSARLKENIESMTSGQRVANTIGNVSSNSLTNMFGHRNGV